MIQEDIGNLEKWLFIKSMVESGNIKFAKKAIDLEIKTLRDRIDETDKDFSTLESQYVGRKL